MYIHRLTQYRSQKIATNIRQIGVDNKKYTIASIAREKKNTSNIRSDSQMNMTQTAGTVEYIEGENPLTIVLDMTRNNQMVRLQ